MITHTKDQFILDPKPILLTHSYWIPRPYHWPVHIGSKVKTRQSQSYKFKEFVKFQIIEFWAKILHTTHRLKMLEMVCKYEMGLMNIAEDTEQIWFCPQTDRWLDVQMDKVKPVYPLQLVEQRVYWQMRCLWWVPMWSTAITILLYSKSCYGALYHKEPNCITYTYIWYWKSIWNNWSI